MGCREVEAPSCNLLPLRTKAQIPHICTAQWWDPRLGAWISVLRGRGWEEGSSPLGTLRCCLISFGTGGLRWGRGSQEGQLPLTPNSAAPSSLWVAFPRGTLASGLESPPPTVAGCPGQGGQPSCLGPVRCHDNLEPPSPTAEAPLKNLSGKLPCLKINYRIEILKMSCFGQGTGQWTWG